MKKFTLLLSLLVLFVACKDDSNDPAGDPAFVLEDAGMAIQAPALGAAKTDYVVRSSGGKWQIVAQNEEDWKWVTIWPKDGEGDGIVKITVAESRVFTSRTAGFEVLIDGEAYSNLFSVTQPAAVPRFSYNNMPGNGELEASKLGEVLRVEMDTNLDFSFDTAADWIKGKATNLSTLQLTVDPIPDNVRQRQATITVTTPSHPQFSTTFAVVQRNIPPFKGLPATWTLKNLSASNDAGKLWISDQLIYSDQTQDAFLQWVRGPLPDTRTEASTSAPYDVSNSDPRLNGMGRKDDAWLFTIPIENGPENQRVKVKGNIRSSGAGVAWYYLQHSTDGATWTTVDPSTYTVKAGVDVPYTVGIRCEDGSKEWPFEKIITIPGEVIDGFYYIRLLVATDVTQNGSVIPSKDGSARITATWSFERYNEE